MSHRFKFRSGSFDIVYIELKPSVGSRQIVRPQAATETRLRRLGEWPKRKAFGAVKSFGVEIASLLLFERDSEGFAIEAAAGI